MNCYKIKALALSFLTIPALYTLPAQAGGVAEPIQEPGYTTAPADACAKGMTFNKAQSKCLRTNAGNNDHGEGQNGNGGNNPGGSGGNSPGGDDGDDTGSGGNNPGGGGSGQGGSGN